MPITADPKALTEQQIIEHIQASLPPTRVEALRYELIARHPEWDDVSNKAMLEGKIADGMTFLHVSAVLGVPLAITDGGNMLIRTKAAHYRGGLIVEFYGGRVLRWSQ
jgi:hypothetical protein